ncbi:uncharacterized protein LOC125776308 isoform X2 [Bactrocera dorsalis]|nr:uncharacterized protein LOC125776308 isoform X2 [Bactrocera dorsalis]
MPTERSPDELETCRCRTVQNRWVPWTGKFWSFFPATWWTVMGSLPKLVCRQLLKWSMLPLRMRVMLLPTLGNVGTQANADSLDIFEVEALEEVAMGQVLEVVPNKQQPKQRTNQSCVEEASSLIENHHAQLKEILERQHKEHMGVLNGIHDTLRALLENMPGATVA